MPVASVSDVTRCVERLFKHSIERRYSDAITVNTSAVSPVAVAGTTNLINAYLFHMIPEGKPVAAEDPTISPQAPVYYSKPVSMFYHLTAHHNAAGVTLYTEQDLLGHALATLVDYGQLDDDLVVNGTPVFDASLTGANNTFSVEVLSKTDTDALNAWAIYDSGQLRPSVFFKVGNVRLAPEAPVGVSAPILSIGQLTLPHMGPRIFSLTNTVTATLPTDAGPVVQQFALDPAQLHLGASAVDSSLALVGAALDQTITVELTLPTASGPLVIDVDMAANAGFGWGVRNEAGKLFIDTGTQLDHATGGVPQTHALEPGTGALRAKKSEILERGDTQVPIALPSNAVSLAFHPHINSVPLVVGDQFQIVLDGDFDLTAMAPVMDHHAMLRLAVGLQSYDLRDSMVGLSAGQAAISGARTIDFILPATTDLTQPLLVQLWVRDHASQPFWIGGGA